MIKPIYIGTRGSPLALIQAQEVKNRLRVAHHLSEEDIKLKVIKTKGDRVTDRALIELGGKGLFTKEIEDAILRGEIDIAVHSMKDVVMVLPEGLIIPCLLPREDVRDVWVCEKFPSLRELPSGGSVGTSSLRRAAQLLHLRPDIKIKVLRGNVETRIEKILRGEVDATLLAFAGLKRLNRLDVVKEIFEPARILPAAGQGAIGIECRIDDSRIQALIQPLHDRDTGDCVKAERAFLRAVEGSCRMPIAALATCSGDKISLTGCVAIPDGRKLYQDVAVGPREAAEHLGFELGQKIYQTMGPEIFKELSL